MLPSHLYTAPQWGATLTRHLKVTLKSRDRKAGSHSAAAFGFTFFLAPWCAAVIDSIHKLLRFIWLQIDNTIRLCDRAESFLSKFRNFGSAEARFNNFCEDKTRSGREMASKPHNAYEAQHLVDVVMEAVLVPVDLARRDYNDRLGQSHGSLSDVLIDIWGELTFAVE